MVFKQGFVMRFEEKSQGDGYGINGGFRLLDPSVIDLVRLSHLISYHREGFWQPMDTLRDKNLLEDLGQAGQSPWKVRV
jgi:glucose-1-phosphate cytidylyltransferase